MSNISMATNQTDPKFIIQSQNLRSYSNYAVCPRCGRSGYTLAEQQCSTPGVISSVFCSSLWAIWQIFKKKDLNCYDTVHYCVECNEILAEYKSCQFP